MPEDVVNPVVTRLAETSPTYRQLATRFDAQHGVMWYYMDATPRPCFNPGLLGEIANCNRLVEQVNRTAMDSGTDCPIGFAVLASRTPGVFSYGGDLEYFKALIADQRREELWQYAKTCIDIVHFVANNFDLPMTTVSLVQGDAFGGGLEAAIACNVVIAEAPARFALPEILFNLFPGMGAYSLLARRIGSARAERIIAGGNEYTAAEFHEMGIVDILVEGGEGEKAVYDFVARHARRRNAYHSIFKVRQRYQPVTYEELKDIALIWVDTALGMPPRDLRIMERLARAQDRRRREADVPEARVRVKA